MAAKPDTPRMTAEEFLAWSDGVAGVWELHAGVPVEMQAERIEHARAKHRAVNALGAALDARGLPCEALPDGISVVTADDTVFIPDGTVRCGDDPQDGKGIYISDPVILVEVI